MKPDRRTITVVACILLAGLAIAQASDRQVTLAPSRTVSLRSSGILDSHAQPLISSSGKTGFVASSAGGSLISFSMTSGKVLSSVSVGQTLGAISMVETSGLRLIAVPAVNDPAGGNPATVSIIDATKAKHLELKSLLVLPTGAAITPMTGAALTQDGRFCLIASSLDVPTLYCFDVESGELVSHLPLIGRPSELALYDSGAHRLLAVASAAANNLAVVKIGENGELAMGATFNPSIAKLAEANNPAFSSDGKLVYVPASTGDRLFAVDSESGIIIDSISIASPARITVGMTPSNVELVAATRANQLTASRKGGATIIANQQGRLSQKCEFTPPDDIEFSAANNVAFTSDGSTAFVASTNGMLFAFNAETGELESYQDAGRGLGRIALSEKTHSIAAVRSSNGGDEVAIVNFEITGPEGSDTSAPSIDSISPEVVEQGRLKNLKLVVNGARLTEGASLMVNGVEMGADLIRKGRALEATLPKSMFNDVASISVQVKGADGSLSRSLELKVVRPGAPSIEIITPSEVPGPSASFRIRVTGNNFRASSAVVVAGQPLNTQQIGARSLEAIVPADIAGAVKAEPLKVEVRDLAVTDLASANAKDLRIYGPKLKDLRPSVRRVVAGGRGFDLNLVGSNFREGAKVELQLNREPVTSVETRRAGNKMLSVAIPPAMIEESGKLAVVVRNPDGSSSERGEIEIGAPEITGFKQDKIYAGSSDLRVDIRGENFRKNVRVYAGNARIDNKHVRFRSSTRLTVTLGADFNRLLEKPGALRFQVVNPNDGDGVPSTDKALAVVGPQITSASIDPAKRDASRLNIVIRGSNFRRGAIVELFKEGLDQAPVIQQKPVKLTGEMLTVVVPAKQIERIGSFRVRVVNSGTVPVPSAAFQPRLGEVASRDE